MQKHLYFICPTDFLESVINNTFREENYYLTSLGNSIVFDTNTVEQVHELLKTKNISNITFVLSDDNRIVSDALGKNEFASTTGLVDLYKRVEKQKERSDGLWRIYDRQFLILSHHLNHKIEELKQGLEPLSSSAPAINAKIYFQKTRVFVDIYPDLICEGYFGMN